MRVGKIKRIRLFTTGRMDGDKKTFGILECFPVLLVYMNGV